MQQYLAQLFPPHCHWSNSTKTRQFYELILLDTQSIELTHTPDKKDPTLISYSKCIIKRVLPLPSTSYFQLTPFSIPYQPSGFTYYDYIQAWSNIFLIRPFTHSWFLAFHLTCPKTFPTWFFDWWLNYGSTSNILPPTVLQAFQHWVSKTTEPSYTQSLLFHYHFRLPWIFCWNYALQTTIPGAFPLSLVREFKIKWWPKYNLDLCTTTTVQHFLTPASTPVPPLTPTPVRPVRPSLPVTPTKPLPHLATLPLPRSPAPTTISDSDEDDDLHQFLAFQQFRKLQQRAKTKSSRTSSPPSSSSIDPFGGPCAQAPEDDPFDLGIDFA